MPRYLCALWAGGGNVGPFLCLAAHLQQRGHEVAAVATTSLASRLSADGVALAGSPDGWLPTAGDLLAAADAHAPDVVIVDYMLTDALCGAEQVEAATVALVHTLYRELLVNGAPHPIGMAGPVEALNPGRSAAGLPPIDRHADLLAAADLVLVAAPRALDAAGDVPPNVQYSGPLLEGPGPDEGWEPPAGSGPLVAVSLGTTGDPAAEVPVLRRVIEALGGMAVRGLVTAPPAVEVDDLGPPPPNVAISGYVRHAAVLPHTDVLVTHAGLGTVNAALAHGVPMVALPFEREQPDNARALVRLGAGVALPTDAPVDDLRDALAGQLARSSSPHVTVDPTPTVDLLEGLAQRG